MAEAITAQHLQEDTRAKLERRLNRIAGQVGGLQRMVADNRYCVDILTQIASVHEALRGVGRVVVANYLENCFSEAIRSGDEERAERVQEELLDIMYRYAR